jgi:plastocyanin
MAGDLQLRVRDREGRGVPDVVVVATATEPLGTARVNAGGPAVMDQQNRRFVPQVLVVQRGTVVAFPNNDTVSHQVYSFSPSRRFQLPLYKGEAHSPIAFDAPGLVVLGCNIHDEMVGYIYVADSPYFATTNADGTAVIRDLPAGGYRIEAWGPRVADRSDTLVRGVTLERSGTVEMELRLQRPLRPRPSPGPRDVDWDY